MKLQEAKYTDRGMAWDITGKKGRKVRSFFIELRTFLCYAQ